MTEYDEIWQDFNDSCHSITPLKEEVRSITDIYECKCGGRKHIAPGALPVCTSCGRVDSLYIDETPEWTNGISEDGKGTDNSRSGDAQIDADLFSGSWGMGTVIRAKWGDTYKMRRMARINFYQSMNSKDRRMYHSYSIIDKVANQKLELSDAVVRTAKVMYKKFADGDVLTRGNNRQGIMGNCIYYACRQEGCPRTIDEVADAYNIDRKFISKMESIFLDVVKPVDENEHAMTPIASIARRLLNSYDIDGKMRIQVTRICDKLNDCSKLMGKHPKTIAATVIMIKLNLSRGQISTSTGVSCSSIGKLEKIVRDYVS